MRVATHSDDPFVVMKMRTANSRYGPQNSATLKGSSWGTKFRSIARTNIPPIRRGHGKATCEPGVSLAPPPGYFRTGRWPETNANAYPGGPLHSLTP